ncbi:hypothetical protein P280DRAFT_244137 [Massarina eburnea CBS 473.64]|uniref:Uncharacterized protein n=1 Tax=Massarina eburnea CBS 473.64 TaxID=1395130 RepID=A0A6A6SAA3_9PLEO|nr:hypothetical protein P280DRAFT_244137 [Massarina eburnea CBS 473.64]
MIQHSTPLPFHQTFEQESQTSINATNIFRDRNLPNNNKLHILGTYATTARELRHSYLPTYPTYLHYYYYSFSLVAWRRRRRRRRCAA